MAARHILALTTLVVCSACTDHTAVSPAPSLDKGDSPPIAGQIATDKGDSRATEARTIQVGKDKSNMRFYLVKGRSLWGDYGDVLVNGYASRKNNANQGELLLKRTGPFIPPVSLPFVAIVDPAIVVSDESKRRLEAAHPEAFTFRPVIKSHIVDSAWHGWNLTAVHPQEYPDGGEPDNYLSPDHSDSAAKKMGLVWELVVRRGGTSDSKLVQQTGWPPFKSEDGIIGRTWNGDHVFWAKNDDASLGKWIFVSETGKKWLSEVSGDWLTFVPVEVN